MTLSTPFKDRLFAKIRETDTCWQWTASLTSEGYGQINDGDGRVVRAHRAVYEILVGPIPEGLDLDHLCRNRACVNPAHLEPVTRAENVRRGVSREASRDRAAAQTHCVAGHEFTAENTAIQVGASGDQRRCRACAARRQREYLERKAARSC